MTRVPIDANHHKGLLALDVDNNVPLVLTGLDLTNSNPLHVAIVDGDGSQLTSFGGGTQYAVDAALGSTPTGTLAIAIRDDTLATLTPVEGDAIGLRVNSMGALWSQDINSAAIKTAVETIDNAISGSEMQVDVVASLPAGDNNIGNVDIASSVALDVSAATVTVDNGGTFVTQVDGAALTALQLIDDVVYADDADWTDGSSKHALVGGLYQSSPQTVTDGDVAPFNITVNGALHTSLVTALPAGTNAIGKLAANSGVDIGDVDVTSISAGTNVIGKVRLVDSGGTEVTETTDHSMNVTIVADDVGIGGGTQYAEDAAHNTGDTGTMALAVRNDTLAALAGTDGDYTPLQVNASGALYAEISSALPAGTNAIGKLAANSGVDIGDVTINNTNLDANLQVGDSDVSDTNPVPVAAEKASSASTSTGVTVGSSSTTVLASNASRKAAIIVNDSDEVVYLKYGTTAASNSGIRLNSGGGTIREEMYTGIITGICASGSKVVTVTEI